MTIAGFAALALAAAGAFEFQDDGGVLKVLEDAKPVLAFHYAMVTPPEGVPESFHRSCYIHPLWGLDGEVLTEDFPKDHYHHRGVFWAWPHSTADGRKMDVWTLEGARQVFQKWTKKEAAADRAVLAFEDWWVFDDAPDKPVIRETVEITIFPAEKRHRAIDFVITGENVSGAEFVLRGSEDKSKGYGGLCFRPDSTRKPMNFTAADGDVKQDVLELATPWADVSFATKPDGKKLSGVAIFQRGDFPGYPHPGWILRNYGFLGQSWPHTVGHTLAPGAAFTLPYRMIVHSGNAKKADVAGLFDAYSRGGSPKK